MGRPGAPMSSGSRRPPATSSRFDPMSGSWPMIMVNVSAVIVVTALSGWAAITVADGWGGLVAYCVISFVALFAFVAVPLRIFLMAQRRASAAREELLSDESERRYFESQLVRALDMSDDRQAALDVAVRGLVTRVSSSSTEVLLADSSRAHLNRVAAAEGDGLGGCGVETPRHCPAVRAGHALHFDDMRALDVCPRLGRPDSGGAVLCVPVSVLGSTTGVIHIARREAVAFEQRDLTTAAGVAQQLGSRLGMLSAMEQSELQASTDPLTGLLNRRSLENHVRALIADHVPFAVALADLDHFKDLNDTYGHDAGDRALRAFSRVLRAVAGQDDLICRYGGEEFLVIMPRAESGGAVALLDRLRLELHTVFADGRTPAFTVSAGVTDTAQGDDLAELVTRADAALLRAKAEGRNRTVVTDFEQLRQPPTAFPGLSAIR